MESPDFKPPSVGASIPFAVDPANVGLWVVSAAPLDDPSKAWTAEPGEYRRDPIGMLPGGHDLPFGFGVGYEYAFAWPYTITSVQVTLRRDDGSLRELRTRLTMLDGNQVVRLKVPDSDARGRLDARVEWQDRCLSYVAVGSAPIRIVPGAVVATCPAGDEDFYAHTNGLMNPALQVGSESAGLGPIETIGHWTPYAVSVQGAFGLELWDPEAEPAAGAAGMTLRVSVVNPALHLTRFGAAFYRRGDALEWRDSGELPRSVFSATAEPYPDGHFELLLPTTPRHYVAALNVSWDSPCAYGGAVGAVAIDVE